MEIVIKENGESAIVGLPESLSVEEQFAYLEKIKQGDTSLEKEFIERNLRLVLQISYKYKESVSDMEDLLSIGTIGLIKATRTFDLSKGILFSTYAGRCIDNEILLSLRKERKKRNEISLQTVLAYDASDDKTLTIEDSLASDFDIEKMYLDKEQSQEVAEAILSLPERDREILLQYYFQDKNQREVGAEMGLAQSYVSRLIKKATNNCKNHLKK